MPKVPLQIRHVTDTDPISLRPKDLVEPEPNEDRDAGRRARKCRRIETIANQYIKLGRVPLIVSAGLRGPLNNGWKNPWVTVPNKPSSDAAHLTNATGKGPQVAQNANPNSARTKQMKANNAQPVSSVPSPEASRGADAVQDSVLPTENIDDEDYTLPAASATQKDNSGATEFFSADLDPSITFDDLESNPFWLKRPQPKSMGFANSTNGNHDPSPTRARLGHRPVDQHGKLLLVTPRQPASVMQSDPGRDLEPEPDWISTASASMIITSPVRPNQVAQQTLSSGPSTRRKRTYSKFERPKMIGNQMAAGATEDALAPNQLTTNDTLKGQSTRTSADIVDHVLVASELHTSNPPAGFTPINGPSRSGRKVPGNVSSPSVQKSNAKRNQRASVSDPYSNEQISDQDARPSNTTGALATSSDAAHTGKKRKKKPANNAMPSLRHNHVTSPTFASSGFMYRKVGEAKRAKSSNGAKPQPVTFSSPDVAKQEPAMLTGHEIEPADEANEHASVAVAERRIERRPDIYDFPGSPQDQEQNYKSNRASDFNTQAALMMAHMEFQDGTMPTIAEGAAAPWLMDSTAHGDPIIPSPAFTPFSKFNATLGGEHTLERTMHDMPISTQDLFATASPFANSTVKKPTKPPASNLRFSVFANREQDSPSHDRSRDGTGSSTNSQRRPLRDKNSRVSFVGSQAEKGSQGERASQDSNTPRPCKAPMVQAVELPHLDFQASNGDLDFTDRFLLNVGEMT